MKCECAAASKITYCLLLTAFQSAFFESLFCYIIIIMCFHLRISNRVQFFSSLYIHVATESEKKNTFRRTQFACINSREFLAFIVFCDQNKCISTVRTAQQNEMFYKYSNLIRTAKNCNFVSNWRWIWTAHKTYACNLRFTRLRSIYFMHQCLHIWFCTSFSLHSFTHKTITYRRVHLRIIPPFSFSFSSSWFGFGIGFSARDILDSINLIGIWYFVWKF